MEGSAEHDARGKSKRKRRRRSKGKDEVDMFSSFIRTARVQDTGRTPAQDPDSSSPKSLEVKENQDHKIHVVCDAPPKYQPSTFCTSFSRREPRGLKRKQPLVDGNDQRLFQSPGSSRAASWAVHQKNAVVQLNELRPGLRYEVMSKTGPLHAPVFSVGVEVNGLRFEGRARTKKQAKMRAAELALGSFIQFPNAPQVQAILGNLTSTAVDFTADKPDLSNTFLCELKTSQCENCDLRHCNSSKKQVFCSLYQNRRVLRFMLDLVSSSNPRRALNTSLLEHLSPVALLNRLRPGLKYICLTERVHGRPTRRFIMAVRVERKVFEGCGRNKRLAKDRAAAAALQSLHNISLGPERRVMGLQNPLPQFFTESIFNLLRDKYTELTHNCSSTAHARHKVLAGIVMTRGLDLRSARVVSLATGTRSLDPDAVSEGGSTLSDCHAEVISRRALLRFLYAQLEQLLCKPTDAQEPSIFVPGGGAGRFRLRDHVLFHMCVSSSPCGDARLNCPYEASAACENRFSSSRRLRCHLRVKGNGGEGTLPVPEWRTNQRCEDALTRQHRVSMSCTDKVAKWSVVGLQGALLAHLVEPVYLHSLTVATLSHTGHLGRALARRLAPVRHLPLPYRRQPLMLGCLSSTEVRPTGKAPNLCLNWTFGDGGLEEISTSTGRRAGSGTPSRLCRRSLFARWQRLQQQVSAAEAQTSGTYTGTKLAAVRYQRAVQQFTAGLQGSGLGTWVRKLPELGHFTASV